MVTLVAVGCSLGHIVSYLVCIKESANIFPVESAGEISWFESVDDADGASILGSLHQIKYGALHNYILQLHCFELCDRYLFDKFGVAVLLWIRGIKSFFILDENHRFRAKYLADEVGSRVGTVR